SGEMELILRSLGRAESRIWIVDQHQRLLALVGDLKKTARQDAPADLASRLIRPIPSLLLERPTEDFHDAPPEEEVADGAEAAIESQGRLRKPIHGSAAGDEIGDLSRSFSTVLERLAQYNTYLENMAGRLSHELRTPIAVVRSSLENLKLARPEEAGVYLARANDGLRRLDTILTRMSE